MTDVFDPTPPPEDYDSENYDIYSVSNNTNANSSTSIYRLQFNSTVDIILQSANSMTANCSEAHPWHLHGHDFWVLGYGEGKFNSSRDIEKYNLVDPIMKNTVPLHPYGWTALRSGRTLQKISGLDQIFIVDGLSSFNTTPDLAIFDYYPNHPPRSPLTVPPAGPVWDDVRPRIAESSH
ncbi:Multicopper oxidase [Theobroma cacao]|nr:Multicopper oxidase [Theobroma cacao]